MLRRRSIVCSQTNCELRAGLGEHLKFRLTIRRTLSVLQYGYTGVLFAKPYCSRGVTFMLFFLSLFPPTEALEREEVAQSWHIP